MKTFELPISDCGCFVAGELRDDTISDFRNNEGALPKHGVIIWYSDRKTALAAIQAVSTAHWDNPSHPIG